jgi:hypothetical protein
MEPRIMVAPDPSAQVLAPNQTIDYVVPTEPQTWIIGFNVNSQQDQGFTFQITDAGTGATLFVQSISSALYSPANANGPIIYLATPRYIEPPSYPVVRITNNANVSNRCAVNLICVTELMQ